MVQSGRWVEACAVSDALLLDFSCFHSALNFDDPDVHVPFLCLVTWLTALCVEAWHVTWLSCNVLTEGVLHGIALWSSLCLCMFLFLWNNLSQSTGCLTAHVIPFLTAHVYAIDVQLLGWQSYRCAAIGSCWSECADERQGRKSWSSVLQDCPPLCVRLCVLRSSCVGMWFFMKCLHRSTVLNSKP